MHLSLSADSVNRPPDVSHVERNVGHFATQGFTDAEIAQSLDLSEDKVAECIASLIRKLGLIDREDLFLFFFRSSSISRVPPPES